jgi:hypothetical protein
MANLMFVWGKVTHVRPVTIKGTDVGLYDITVVCPKSGQKMVVRSQTTIPVCEEIVAFRCTYRKGRFFVRNVIQDAKAGQALWASLQQQS